MYGENYEEWHKRINELTYTDKGLSVKVQNYINKQLNIKGLRLFLNFRYPADPLRYDNMKKKELISKKNFFSLPTNSVIS